MIRSARTTMWDPRIAETARDLGLVLAEERVVVGGPAWSPVAQQDVARVTRQLLRLILSLGTRAFADDRSRMAAEMGLFPGEMRLLESFDSSITEGVFARADILFAGRSWHVIEVNIGSTVGGLFYASLPRLVGLAQDGDVLAAWADELAARSDFDGGIAMVEDERYVAYIRRAMPTMARELEQRSGCPVLIASQRELGWDGARLHVRGQAIRDVYRFFTPACLARSPESYQPLFAALRAGAVRCPMGPIYALVSNKGVLAKLWELVDQGELTPDESKLVRSHVPRTEWVTEATFSQLVSSWDRWVLKPIQGAGGEGVIRGTEVGRDQFTACLRAALARDAPRTHVAQEYVEPDPVEVVYVDPDNALRTQDARTVWGVYHFGDRYCGAFVRAQPIHASAIVNYARGAAVGPVPPT